MALAYQKNYKGYKGAMPRLQPLRDSLTRVLHQRLYCKTNDKGMSALGSKYATQLDEFQRKLENFLNKCPTERMCLKFIKENQSIIAQFKTGNYYTNHNKLTSLINKYEIF